MATTAAELQRITAEHNKVRSAGQARVAIGEALNALGRAYKMRSNGVSGELQTRVRNELDQARGPLERWYQEITALPNQDYSVTWSQKRGMVQRAYVAIAGAEGVYGYESPTSNWAILATSLREAPAVFLQGVGSVAKEVGKTAAVVAREAGNVAGAAAGGIASGLGIGGTAMAVGAVILILKFGSPMGAVSGVTKLLGGVLK